MSPQKKLLLRRNALFRQQLSKSDPWSQIGQSQNFLPGNVQASDLHQATTDQDNCATACSLQNQLLAER